MGKMQEILKKLMDDHGDDAYSLESKSGVPQPTTHRFLSGKHGDPRSSTVKKWAMAYGLSESQLRGDEPINNIDVILNNRLDNSLSIPLLSAAASMGNGVEVYDSDMVIDVLRITKSWISKNLPTITSISNLTFIHAIGDSMAPTFNDGDILLVDSGVKTVSSDNVYVLRAHNRLFIKRVRQRINGTFEISSDNPSVKTVDVLNGDYEIEIMGRVVWVWNGKRI